MTQINEAIIKKLEALAQQRGLSLDALLSSFLRPHDPQSILMAIGEGVVVYDASGQPVICNTAAERILGRSCATLGSWLQHGPDWDAVQADGTPFAPDSHPLRVVMRTGEAQQDVVMQILRPDDTRVWISIKVEPTPDQFIVSFRDVTPQMESEVQLREERSRYRALFKQSSDVIFVTDHTGRFLDVNQAGLDLFGYTREELDQINALDVYAKEADRQQILALLAEHGELSDYEVLLKKKDGSHVYCRVSSTARRDAEGRIIRIYGVAHDISSLKQALTSVQENEARLQQAFNVAHIGIWEWYLDDDRATWAGDMFRMYGIIPEEFTGRGSDYLDFTHHEDRQTQLDNIQRAFENGLTEKQLTDGSLAIPYNPRHFRIIRPDGSICYVRGDAVAVVDEEGNPVRMIGVLHDVTDITLVQQNLEERLRFEQIVSFVSTLLLVWTPESQADILSQITALIATYLDADRSTMFILDENQHLRPLVRWRREGIVQQGSDRPQTDFPWYTRQIIENDFCCYLAKELPDEAINERVFCEALGIQSFMSIRLQAEGRVLGGFTFDSLGRDYEWWTTQLLHRLQTIGEIISIGLLRQQFSADLQRRNVELGAFFDIAQAIGGNLELDTILNIFLEKLMTLVPYESASIAFVENDGLRFVAQRGLPEGSDLEALADKLRLTYGGRQAFPINELVHHGDVREVDGWVQFPDIEYIRSWIGIPLKHNNKLQGMLHLDHSVPHFFTPDHVRKAEAVSHHLAMTLENVQLVSHLEERVVEQTRQLRQSEERHRLISEIMSDYVYSASVEEGGITDIDWVFGAFEEITGYTVSEINALPGKWATIVNEDDDTRFEGLKDEFRRGDSYVYEYRITAKDGTICWLRDYFRPIWDGPTIVRYAGAVQDITRTKTAELKLQAEQAQREIILSNIADAILFTDRDGTIVYANPAWEKLTGYSLAEVEGKPSRLLQTGHTPLQTYEELWEAISHGDQWTGVLGNQRKDGTIYDALITLVPVLDSENEIINFVELQRDVTEERQLAELKEAFIANAAHDLRNPITILSNALYLMKRQPNEMEKWTTSITAQVERLDKLVADLLTIARLDRKVVAPAPSIANVNDVIKHVVEAQRLLIADKQLTLSTSLCSDPLLVRIDADHIERIMVNLIANAINYSSDGGVVHVTTQMRDPQVWIEVRDEGIGIAPEDLPHIFERFYRAENAKLEGQGTGLGLSIVKQIVELNQGSISVQSEPGKGSTFLVRFPLIRD